MANSIRAEMVSFILGDVRGSVEAVRIVRDVENIRE